MQVDLSSQSHANHHKARILGSHVLALTSHREMYCSPKFQPSSACGIKNIAKDSQFQIYRYQPLQRMSGCNTCILKDHLLYPCGSAALLHSVVVGIDEKKGTTWSIRSEWGLQDRLHCTNKRIKGLRLVVKL